MGQVEDGIYRPYEEEDYDTGTHDYGTNNEYELSKFVFLFLLVLLASVLFSNVIKHRPYHWFPEAGAPLVIGMIVGLIAKTNSNAITDALLRFDPTIFFVGLLPPIIFNSGYSMKRRFFFQNFISILTFAVFGTLLSTIIFGVGLYVVGNIGVAGLKLSFAECLTFGALISATDPVSTLSVFQELRVDPMLFYLVFGESVLNDAVSIVLFRTFSKFVGYSHSVTSIFIAVLDFVLIFVGSTLIGIFIGFLAALLFKYFNFHHETTHEIGVLFIFSYVPFLVAEAVEMSGIVSILFAGMSMKHYAHNNLSPDAQSSSIVVFQLISNVAETVVFLNLGLSVFTLPNGYYGTFILWSIVLCLIARAMHVYPLSFLLNLRVSKATNSDHESGSVKRIEKNTQHMLWFSGLRGAIAFALSLSFPGNHRSEIISTTMVIVIATVFILGGATASMLNYLSIKQLTASEERQLDIHTRPADTIKFLLFDTKYLRPFFTKLRPAFELTEQASPNIMEVAPSSVPVVETHRRVTELRSSV